MAYANSPSSHDTTRALCAAQHRTTYEAHLVRASAGWLATAHDALSRAQFDLSTRSGHALEVTEGLSLMASQIVHNFRRLYIGLTLQQLGIGPSFW